MVDGVKISSKIQGIDTNPSSDAVKISLVISGKIQTNYCYSESHSCSRMLKRKGRFEISRLLDRQGQEDAFLTLISGDLSQVT